jgi:hypothetical protein
MRTSDLISVGLARMAAFADVWLVALCRAATVD